MKREQDKKPDFLGDLNAGILEELTRGGKLQNVAGLAGEVKEAERITKICGLPFDGYLVKVETPRPSGIIDEVAVAIERKTAIMQGGITFENELKPGSRLLLAGKIQTLKDFTTGRVLVFILADYVAISPKAMLQNDIALMGELASKPTYRETPRGKRISDIFIKVKKELAPGNCHIPCICWQEQADEVARWQQGDKIRLLARYQSREYSKVISELYADGEVAERGVEQRTAYELSVRMIERIGGKE